MIKFGTDGWRANIAKDFTFENLHYAALGTANYLLKKGKKDLKVVVGYDTRFLSDTFAAEVSKILAEANIKVVLSDSISTTPQVSYLTKTLNADLGVVITASHNPPEYSGYKVKGYFGGPSSPEEVADIEKEVNDVEDKSNIKELKDLNYYIDNNLIQLIDFKKDYYDYLKKQIDIEAIQKANFKILYDPMFGAGIQNISHVLNNVETIHDYHSTNFGNIDHPEPIAECLEELITKVKNGNYDFAFATDGDADRIGTVDEDGNFIDSHRIYMILLKYLYEHKGIRGKVAKTVSLTTMVNNFCEKHNIELIETPVGFKYIAKLMVEEDILIGGEESGGLSTKLHIPERDGIFNAMLLLEVMVKRNMSLKQLSDELDSEFGVHRYRRKDIKVKEEEKDRVLNKCKSGVDNLSKYKVIRTDNTDGYKFFVDGGWLLIRASGTEPLLRIYSEAKNYEMVEELIHAGLNLS
jgi:alpha-D-glucose phosphate-specific phosphoglucomutase